MTVHHEVAKQLEALHQIPPERRTRGQRIRAARLRLGWSQEALACDVDVTGSLIGKMERDDDDVAAATVDRVLTYVEREARAVSAPPLPVIEPPPPPPPGASYGETLRHAREVARLTQPDLARRLGIQKSMVSEVEAGRRGALADWHLPALAELFGHDTALHLARASLRLSHLSLRVEDDDPRAPLAAELAVRWDTLTDGQIAALRAVLDDA